MVEDDDRISLISPVGYSASTCGYCTPSGSGQRSNGKSSKSYGIWANNITPETYQQLLDRNWRRSGSYIYRPDCGYDGTCCPQIAIRIPVDKFRPRCDQKRAILALQKLVRQPLEGQTSIIGSQMNSSHKGKYSQRWDIERQWRAIEWSEAEDYRWEVSDEEGDQIQKFRQLMKPIHNERKAMATKGRRDKESVRGQTKLPPLVGPKRRRFETTLRVADSTIEKYQIFRSYQMKIHGESDSKVSNRKGFERFLCSSPLMSYLPVSSGEGAKMQKPGEAVDVLSDSPIAYDLYHMEYRYEGRLIAVGVLDILPRSVSSVYLFYDPDFAHLHLGKVSVIREMALVKQLRRKKGMEGVQHYNLGLYIHSCPKMRYKAEYRPAEVLDPMTYEWTLYSDAKAQMDRGVRYSFLHHSVDKPVPARRSIPNVKELPSDADEGEEEEEEDMDTNLPLPPPPGILDPTHLPSNMLAYCLIFDHGRISPLSRTDIVRQPATLQKVMECLAALGPLYNRFCLYF